MKKEVKYKAKFKDAYGINEIIILNDFNNLSFELDGVQFIGKELSDFRVLDREKYSEEQLNRFKFFAIPIYNSNQSYHALCNCSFEVIIPQWMINVETGQPLSVELLIEYSLLVSQSNTEHEKEKIKLSVLINKTIYEYEGSGDFESALTHIQNQTGNRYHFKNCFGCLYSDYSVYGQSILGSMECFVTQKDEYLKVKTKDNYMDFCINAHSDIVQEIYCCNKFEMRKKGTGYRG